MLILFAVILLSSKKYGVLSRCSIILVVATFAYIDDGTFMGYTITETNKSVNGIKQLFHTSYCCVFLLNMV